MNKTPKIQKCVHLFPLWTLIIRPLWHSVSMLRNMAKQIYAIYLNTNSLTAAEHKLVDNISRPKSACNTELPLIIFGMIYYLIDSHNHSDPVGVAFKIFSRRVGTINRVERRGPAQPVMKIWRTSPSFEPTCFASLRCLRRQCCCFRRCSGRCWGNRAKVLFSTDHGPGWRLLLSRRGSQLALSAWIWRAAQALTGRLKRRWK